MRLLRTVRETCAGSLGKSGGEPGDCSKHVCGREVGARDVFQSLSIQAGVLVAEEVL